MCFHAFDIIFFSFLSFAVRTETVLRAALHHSQQQISATRVDVRRLAKELVSRNVLRKAERDEILESQSPMQDLLRRMIDGSVGNLTEFTCLLHHFGHKNLVEYIFSVRLPVRNRKIVGCELVLNHMCRSAGCRSITFSIFSRCIQQVFIVGKILFDLNQTIHLTYSSRSRQESLNAYQLDTPLDHQRQTFIHSGGTIYVHGFSPSVNIAQTFLTWTF